MREFSSRWVNVRLSLLNIVLFTLIALILFLLRGVVSASFAGAALVYGVQVCDIAISLLKRYLREPRRGHVENVFLTLCLNIEIFVQT